MPHSTDFITQYKNTPFLYAFNYYSSLAKPAGCGGNLTGHAGVFSSPLYPQILIESEDRVCSWLIHSNGYHTLTLTFDFLQLSFGCEQNKIVVYDADEAVEEKKRATFCLMVRKSITL